MTDLSSLLLAAIEQKATKAEAAKSLTVLLNWPRQNGKATIRAFMDDNAPAAILRRCAADRRTVEQWVEESNDWRAGLSEDELHDRRSHPAYEYETTEGRRKAWDYSNVPPPGEGWERNKTASNPEAWERFEHTEESYWRRLRPEGPEVWKRHVPYFIRNLAESYGLDIPVEGETT